VLENERGPAEREEPKQGKQPRQPIALAHPFLGGSAVRNGEVSPVQRARGEPLRRGGRLGGARRALGVVVRGDDAHLAWWCARAPSSRSEFVSPGGTYIRERTRSLTTSPSTRDPSCDACRMDRLGGIGIYQCSEIVPYYHSLILLQRYTGVESTLCVPFVSWLCNGHATGSKSIASSSKRTRWAQPN
jgi:hypothetical protein